MPKHKRIKNIRARHKKRASSVATTLIAIGVIVAIITVLNLPLISISYNELSVDVTYRRSLSVTLINLKFNPEASLLRTNATHVSIEAVVLDQAKKLVVIPLKPGEDFKIGSTVSYNITNQVLPVTLFIRDNVTGFTYPVALISSTKKAYLPLSTYLYVALLEAHIVNNEALIRVSTESPIILHVEVNYTEENVSKRVVGPITGTKELHIGGTFEHLKVSPFIVMGPLVLKIQDNTAILYPNDNTQIFIALSATFIVVGLVLLHTRGAKGR